MVLRMSAQQGCTFFGKCGVGGFLSSALRSSDSDQGILVVRLFRFRGGQVPFSPLLLLQLQPSASGPLPLNHSAS